MKVMSQTNCTITVSLSFGELLIAEFKFSKSLPIKLGDMRSIFSIPLILNSAMLELRL